MLSGRGAEKEDSDVSTEVVKTAEKVGRKGPQGIKMWGHQELRKGQEIDSSLEPSEGTSLADTWA